MKHEPCGRHYCFYRIINGERRRFAVLIATKKKITVAIRVIPELFEDVKKMTRDVKGWFFGREKEKRFDVKSLSEIDYALNLIKQSYDVLLASF